MKMLLKKLIPVLVLFVGTSAFAQYRIATVDLGRVFTNYWKTKQADMAIQEQRADMEKTDKDMIATFNKGKDDYQKLLDSVNDPAVSSEERDKRKKDAEAKLMDLKRQGDDLDQFERGSQARLVEQSRRTSENIFSDIKVVVTAKAKTDGYTLVVDTAGRGENGIPIVVYYLPGDNDITDAVIKQLNIGAPVDTPKSDDQPVAQDKDKASGK